MRIYLCGGIRKDENDQKVVWTGQDKETIRGVMGGVELLDPQRTPELSDPMAAFGCDLRDVREADALLVDMRQRRGIGIGAEMAIARFMGKPVVSVCPRNSHFRRDTLEHRGCAVRDWVHPFMFGLSDFIAESVEEAAEWLREWKDKGTDVKDGSFVEEAIRHFERSGKGRI